MCSNKAEYADCLLLIDHVTWRTLPNMSVDGSDSRAPVGWPKDLSDSPGLGRKTELRQITRRRAVDPTWGCLQSADSQMIESNTFESLTFTTVILRHSNSEVLLVRDGFNFELPIVMIPKWRRVAQEITKCILRLWGLKTIVLFQREAPSNGSADTDHYVVLEARDSSWQPPAGFGWVSRQGLRYRLLSTKEACPLEEALAAADAYNDGSLDGAFARAGWFDDLVSWAQEQIEPHRLSLTGEFHQLNGDPSFSLVRLETTGPAVWFKAVGEPNRHEFPVTVMLARRFPSYLPGLIAIKPSWNGWLTFEVAGSMLDENSDLSSWEKAAGTLANLQIESVQQTQALLDASCRDIRTWALLEQIDPFFNVMAELMAKQPKVPPPVLNLHEVHALGVQLKEICSCLGGLGLPDTLGHLDFNPGNIVAAPDGCVFLDWAEAYVGPPFFTFEYLREHLSRIHPSGSAWRSRVTSRYVEPWSSLVSADKLSQALEITPLLAVFAYAVGSGAWRDSQRLQKPQMAGYLRALTRRMQREARVTMSGGSDA